MVEDAREGGLISDEAFGIADDVAVMLDIDPKCPPVDWYGAPHTVSAWLIQGWTRELIITACRVTAKRCRERGIEIRSIRFFANDIARELARRQERVPVVKPGTGIELANDGGGNAAARSSRASGGYKSFAAYALDQARAAGEG